MAHYRNYRKTRFVGTGFGILLIAVACTLIPIHQIAIVIGIIGTIIIIISSPNQTTIQP